MDELALDYASLIQDIRRIPYLALDLTARNGLPPGHHFVIYFRTAAPGVELPEHLRSAYPQEMVIILQHQFWDLEVSEVAFEVTLAFQGVKHRLRIPFQAVTTFADPEALVSLHFGPRPEEAEPTTEPKDTGASDESNESTVGGKVIQLDQFRNR